MPERSKSSTKVDHPDRLVGLVVYKIPLLLLAVLVLIIAVPAYFAKPQMLATARAAKAASAPTASPPKPTSKAASAPVHAVLSAVDEQDRKNQLDQAEILQGNAWEKMESGNVAEALPLAEKALTIRTQWAPNSVLMAQSLHQVAYLLAERCYHGEDNPTLKQRAEDLYLQAIKMVPESEMYSPKAGRSKYMRDLADLYMEEGNWDKASTLLEEVCKKFAPIQDTSGGLQKTGAIEDITAVNVWSINEPVFLEQFARLYWGQNNDIEAAKIEVRLQNPDIQAAELQATKVDFGGRWTILNEPGQSSFALTLQEAGADKLKASVTGKNLDAKKADKDNAATGTFNGSVGEVNWTAFKGQGRAKIVRLGDYLVWKIQSMTGESFCPVTAVLQRH